MSGFDAFPTEWAIDWSLFFDIGGSGKKVGKERVQPAYKIDPSLVNPLGFLPEFSQSASPTPASGALTIDDLQAKEDVKLAPSNLAVRNLLRGMSMALPSGQDVARAMGVEPVDDKNLRICKAIVDDWSGRIVAETLIGLLLSDSHSYLRQAPHWHPKSAVFLKVPYDMGALIKFALNL